MSGTESVFRGKVILAPLAGITNLPFRLIARRHGCEFCFTEMISANGLIRDSKKTFEYLQSCPEDSPLGIQLFGSDASIMAEAARMVARQNPEVIDINMGCPVRKVVKSGAGAKLMTQPKLAGSIIEAVVKAVNIPVTVKIRAGWRRNCQNALEISKIAQESGAAAVILHARTADQGFSGHADWRVIAEVKNAINIPVVGNGDIRRPQDALDMQTQTGCDCVMVGRGALGNPWIFESIRQLFTGGLLGAGCSLDMRREVIKSHWDLEVNAFGEPLALRTFRKHLLWYTKGLPGSGHFRDIVGKMKNIKEILIELEAYFSCLDQAAPQNIILTDQG